MFSAIRRLRLFIFCALGSFIFIFLCMSAANFLFDPLHILTPPEQSDTYDRQSRYALPALLRQNNTDIAFIGTSVIQDLDETNFREIWGKPVSRYPMRGATSYEQRRMAETLLGAKNPPKRIIWGLDLSSFTGDERRVRWDKFPEHLYRNDALIYPSYIFSFDTFSRLIRILISNDPEYTPQNRFFFEAPDLEFSRNAVFRSYCGEGLDRRLDEVEKLDFSTQRAHILNNMAPVIRANSTTEFDLFFPPYSAVQIAEFSRGGALQAMLDFRSAIVQELGNLENVRIFDFQSDRAIVTDLNLYRDPLHYNSATLNTISRAIFNGEHLVPMNNLETGNAAIIDIEKEYQDIWQQISEYCENNPAAPLKN